MMQKSFPNSFDYLRLKGSFILLLDQPGVSRALQLLFIPNQICNVASTNLARTARKTQRNKRDEHIQSSRV